MCGARGKEEILSQRTDGQPACDLGREVLSVKVKMQPCFFYQVFTKGYPVSKVENSRSDTEMPSQKGLPAKEINNISPAVRLCKKNPRIALLSLVMTLPNCEVWSEPRGFCRFVFGVFPHCDPIVESSV